MISRCTNTEDKNFFRYGERGIRVHETWVNCYATFLKDVGRRPSDKHSIDRIDNNGHYEPGNVRWATKKQQCLNRRSNRIIEYNGRSQTLQEWVEELKIDRSVVKMRLRSGWSGHDAFTKPLMKKGVPRPKTL